jgi:hypothetical protein
MHTEGKRQINTVTKTSLAVIVVAIPERPQAKRANGFQRVSLYESRAVKGCFRCKNSIHRQMGHDTAADKLPAGVQENVIEIWILKNQNEEENFRVNTQTEKV